MSTRPILACSATLRTSRAAADSLVCATLSTAPAVIGPPSLWPSAARASRSSVAASVRLAAWAAACAAESTAIALLPPMESLFEPTAAAPAAAFASLDTRAAVAATEAGSRAELFLAGGPRRSSTARALSASALP